jgi:hypothetical protein
MTIKIGETVTLEKVAAAIEQLSASDRAKLLDKLGTTKINDLKAAADKARFDRLNAAATDPRYEVALRTALRGLSRLGLELEAVAAAGDTKALDKAMTEAKWSQQERVQLKTVLANVGAIR